MRAVVVDALGAFFRRRDEFRRVAAVQRHVAGAVPRSRAGELAGAWGDGLDATVAAYRDRVRGGETTAVTVTPGSVAAAVGAVDPGLADLVRGAANAGVDGCETDGDVVRAAVEAYWREHEALRHAAAARRYAAPGRATVGFAAGVADTSPGRETLRLLRDHGVRPLVGPVADEEARRARRLNALVVGADPPEE